MEFKLEKNIPEATKLLKLVVLLKLILKCITGSKKMVMELRKRKQKQKRINNINN